MPIQVGRVYQDVAIEGLQVKRTEYGFAASFAFNDANENFTRFDRARHVAQTSNG